jgi:hypothetical protein
LEDLGLDLPVHPVKACQRSQAGAGWQQAGEPLG